MRTTFDLPDDVTNTPKAGIGPPRLARQSSDDEAATHHREEPADFAAIP